MSAEQDFNLAPHIQRLEELCGVARDFGARGWTPATSGNYSVRLDHRYMAVTCSGVEKRSLAVDDLMVTDLNGQPVDAGKPSAEALLHGQLYRWQADLGAILHVHSPSATLASRLCAGEGQITLSNYELLKAFEGIATHEDSLVVPVLPNRQDIPELCALLSPWLDTRPLWCYLIEGHGVYAWGADVRIAARHLEAIDFLLESFLAERRYR